MEMEASVQTQKGAELVKKRLYRNNTGGYLGVVVLSPKGEELGVNVDPYGTIWLSDEEAILTSRAPKDPANNPFQEQTFVIADPETGGQKEIQMCPLVLEGDGETYVPARDRFVPFDTTPAHAADLAERAAKGEQPERIVAAPPTAAPEAQIAAPAAAPPSSGAPPAPAPAAAAAVAPSPPVRSEPAPTNPAPSQALVGTSGSSDGEAEASWTEPPEAPDKILPGRLGGSNEPAAEAQAAAAPDTAGAPAAPAPPPQRPVPQAPPQSPPPGSEAGPMVEEHAAAVDPEIGEETGAAKPPTGVAPQGEYAQAEEIGSPAAPDQSSSSDREE